MTETLSSPSEKVRAPHIDGAPEGLQLKTLDDLVNCRSEIARKFDDQDDKSDYRAFEDEYLDALLNENGITDDPDDYDKHTDYEYAKGIYRTVVNTRTSADWVGMKEGDEVPLRNRMHRDIMTHYEEKPADKSDDFLDQLREQAAAQEQDYLDVLNESDQAKADRELLENEKTTNNSATAEDKKYEEILSSKTEEFRGIREHFAELVAERSKSVIEGSRTRDDIEAAKAELSEWLPALATNFALSLEAKGLSWDEIPEEVDKFLENQSDKVLSAIENHRMEEYNKSRYFKKFYDAWAAWGEQGAKGKLKKAAVFAIPGAAMGAVLVPIAGVLSFGAVTGGAAVAASRSIARTFAGGYIDKRAQAGRVAERQTAEIRTEHEKNGGNSIDLVDLITKKSELYRKHNRNRMVGKTAIALTVGLVSGAAANALVDGRANLGAGKLGEFIKGKWGGKFGGVEVENPSVGGIFGTIEQSFGNVQDRLNDVIETTNDPDSGSGQIPEGESSGGGRGEGSGEGRGVEGLSRESMFDGRFGTRHVTPEARDLMSEYIKGHVVKQGDTVWALSEQFLNDQGIKNPTIFELDAAKDALYSDLQASGHVDEHGWLTIGDTLHTK